MDTPTESTPVIFRYDRCGEVVAVFPDQPADYTGRLLTCYVHLGQHVACSFDWYRTTRPATSIEAAPLRSELAAIGYTLREYRRITPRHRASFVQSHRAYLAVAQ